MPTRADIDRLARELYDKRRRHTCGVDLALADELAGRCPTCGALVLAGPIAPARARAMLGELRARRVTMGLNR